MQETLQLKSQFLQFSNQIVLTPPFVTTLSLQSLNFSSKFPIFTASPLISRKTQIQKPIICARKSKRKYGSERSTKLMLELLSILASNLKIFPQPLDLVVHNLVAGDGEGLKFLNGFNGGGFKALTIPTRKRRNGKKILGFLAVLGCSCILYLLFGKEFSTELLFGVLGFIFFVAALIKEWRKGLKDWIFGICCFGILVGLGLRGNEAMKWVQKTTAVSSSSSIMEIVRKGKRRGRWAFLK